MRLLSPLRVRVVALLWGGLSTSSVGDQLGTIAITWIAVAALGPAAGYLAACQAGVTLLAALLLGRWLDGRNERRVMIAADLIRAAVLGGVVLGWAVTGRVGVVSLAMIVTVLAVGQAAFRPAVQTIMPGLAPSEAMLPAINALFDGTDRLARLVGPALIALAAAWLPVVHFLTVDAASFLVSAAAVLLIGPRATRSVRHDGSRLASFLQGFRALRRHRLLGFLLYTSGIVNGAWYAALFLGVPLLLTERGDQAVRMFGAMIACYGVTNLAANLVVGSRPLPQRPALLSLWGNAVNGIGIALIGLCALVPGLPRDSLYAGAMLAGVGGPMNDIPRATLMQTSVPAADVAAGFRAWIVSANAGLLVAMVVAPTLFARLGPAMGIAALGCLIAASAFWGLVLRLDAA
ncbi:MAG TPA: MFS transporter [Rhodopila sp.]|uniref:MFS transporter n=1 Tax=Rhodopila sp. TaxID=2480087 RepID=UPI002C9704D5|nr:MFS transporter [Rhodopila sp.]HVY17348.1 MFS transporter [Rhodopila sp.]